MMPSRAAVVNGMTATGLTATLRNRDDRGVNVNGGVEAKAGGE
jgi:hypothetical protein